MSNSKITKLPESELEIMLVIWKHSEPVRTSCIMAEINREWTQSTVKALLSRLVEKGFLQVTRQGRFTLYQALVNEEDYRRQETSGLLHRYYQGSVKNMVAALVNESALTGADLEELESIIRNAGRD